MDVSHPIRAAIPSLDGPVLEVVAGTTVALTARKIHRLCTTGSYSGVRKVLLRLVRQGILIADERGNATYFSANRDHLAWPAIESLARLRPALLAWLRERFEGWMVPAVHASLFGSTARGDGDEQSDIDVLAVRPDELDSTAEERWQVQLDALREGVRATTGNRCQVFEVTASGLREHVKARDPLITEWRRDAVHLAGADLGPLLRTLEGRPA